MIPILLEYREAFLQGLWVTLQLSLTIWGVGLVVGGFLGVMETIYPKSIGLVSRSLSFIISSIPILVFLFWLHYPLQEAFQVVIDPFLTAAFTLSVVNIFTVAGIVRNGIEQLPRQYVETALVCGLTPYRTLRVIQIPMILRHILPSLLESQVNMLHLTLFASLISVNEIFRMAQRVNSIAYKPVEIYTALGIFFLIVCLPLNGLALALKWRFSRDISEK